MRAFPSLSGSFRRLSPRERRVVGVGAAISVAALGATQLVLPFADRWAAREDSYAATRDRWTRLDRLAANEAQLRRGLAQARGAGDASGELLMPGATAALAASGLQMLLRSYAEESQVRLDRVDVAGQAKPDRPGLLAIPVMMQGQGDIYGLVDFLFRLQHGERLLVVDQITTNTSFGRGEDESAQLLTWSVSAHGLYPAPDAGTQ